MMDVDKLLEQYRKPQRIVIFNTESEVRSICDPNYRRREKMLFYEMKKKVGAP